MNEPSFPDINRAAVIVKLKKPFIDWLVYTSLVTDSNDAIKRLNICNGASKEHDGPGHELKPEDVQTEGFDSKHVYLIPAYDETEKYEKFVKKHCTEIFEHELSGWYTDPQMWPKDRSWKVFQEWFDYEIQTIVLDMADKPIEYEE